MLWNWFSDFRKKLNTNKKFRKRIFNTLFVVFILLFILESVIASSLVLSFNNLKLCYILEDITHNKGKLLNIADFLPQYSEQNKGELIKDVFKFSIEDINLENLSYFEKNRPDLAQRCIGKLGYSTQDITTKNTIFFIVAFFMVLILLLETVIVSKYNDNYDLF